MTRIVTFAGATLAAVTIAAAQTTTQPPSTQPPSSDRSTARQPAAQSSQLERKIMVNGCLKGGASSGSFILADAGTALTTGTGRDGQLGVAGTSGMMKAYKLVVKPSDDLSKHVNHRIEVTGTVSAQRADASASSEAGRQEATPQPGAAAKPGAPAQPTEILNVQAFKMISIDSL